MGAGQHAFLVIGQTHKVILHPVLERKTKGRTDEDKIYNYTGQELREYVTSKQYRNVNTLSSEVFG